jgi:hypothetical protein
MCVYELIELNENYSQSESEESILFSKSIHYQYVYVTQYQKQMLSDQMRNR